MNVPDLEFIVVIQPHTEAGRNWLAKRMMPKNSMCNGVVVRAVDSASRLGAEAVADGLRTRVWSTCTHSRKPDLASCRAKSPSRNRFADGLALLPQRLCASYLFNWSFSPMMAAALSNTSVMSNQNSL